MTENERKKVIIRALQHFIRYNKPRYKIVYKNVYRDGLCGYVWSYVARKVKGYDEQSSIRLMFKELVKGYCDYDSGGLYISRPYYTTKKRLNVANKIIEKLKQEIAN
jgi:hypothetical protein